MEERSLVKVDLEIQSDAQPEPGLLRLARHVVQRNPDVSQLFVAAKQQSQPTSWLQEQLQIELNKIFIGEEANVREVSRYLSDEYFQIGDGILLISSDTGRAIAKLTDEDFYQPSPVPREGSSKMATPGLRIRPELEGFIVQWTFDRSKEKENVEALRMRNSAPTVLLQEEGDNRLHFTTLAGRRALVNQVRESLPNLSLTTKAFPFFDFLFTWGVPSDTSKFEAVPIQVYSSFRVSLHDPLTRNIQHSIEKMLLSTIPVGWVRQLLTEILRAALKSGRAVTSGTFDEFVQGRDFGVWVVPTNLYLELQRRGSPTYIAAHEAAEGHALYLSYRDAVVGHLANLKFDCSSRELFDRWTLDSKMEGTLWIDWSKIEVFALEGVIPTGISIEPKPL